VSALLTIGGRRIGPGEPAYIVAEMSANHGHRLEDARRIVQAARDAGADAVKLQTYTPDTMTIDCRTPHFVIQDTIWKGRNLYELYGEAFTPWEWHDELKGLAESLGLQFFSTAFDETSVDFLEQLQVPAYKIASFELTDLPLLRKVASTGKPVILSTGMATVAEIEEALTTLRGAGAGGVALLKCTSAYPASPEEMNLRTIPDLARRFDRPVGLSDHTMDAQVPVMAIALGACIIEKHLTLSRADPGPDSAFSLEPAEFQRMVAAVRVAERALGDVSYGATGRELSSMAFRRSLFVVQDVARGERLTRANVAVIRPAAGLHPRHLDEVLGARAASDVSRGTPLTWNMIQTADTSGQVRG
jgi:pseudaminic acid synthase